MESHSTRLTQDREALSPIAAQRRDAVAALTSDSLCALGPLDCNLGIAAMGVRKAHGRRRPLVPVHSKIVYPEDVIDCGL